MDKRKDPSGGIAALGALGCPEGIRRRNRALPGRPNPNLPLPKQKGHPFGCPFVLVEISG